MTGKITHEKLLLFEELRAGGIPVDEYLLEQRQKASRKLLLEQTGNIVDNTVFAQAWGETCFMLSMAITNVSTKQAVKLQARRLQIPWPEPNFRWLEYPLGKFPASFRYSHPACGPADFDPEVVLNHRIGRHLKLLPDDSIEGLLIGAGELPVPEQYPDRQGVRMRLSLYDTNDNFNRVRNFFLPQC